MFVTLSIAYIFGITFLLLVAAIRPSRSQISWFELDRRAAECDREARLRLRQERQVSDVLALQRTVVAILLVLLTLLAIYSFDWPIGIALSVLLALVYGSLARLWFVKTWSQVLYKRFSRSISRFIKKHSTVMRLIKSQPTVDALVNYDLSSRAELQHIIAASMGVLNHDEQSLIINSLSFGNRTVRSIMTSRDMIKSLDHNEFLGPLALDELHKAGHNILPVTAGDIDHIVGILNIKNLLSLDIKRSMTAEKAMDHRVYYIREDHSLRQALTAFLHTHHHLFVVVNKSYQTVGLLTMGDIIRALLGRQPNDDFDAYDDVKAVAQYK